MLDILLIIWTIYFVLKLYIAVMQIGYINQEKLKGAVILSASKYIKAASYAVKTQKLSILEAMVEYVSFIVWLNFGLHFLDSIIPSEIGVIYKSIVYVLSFLFIGYLISLPLSIYKTFYLDKEFGFTNIDAKTYILDSIKSIILTMVAGGLVIAVLAYIISSYELWWLWGFVFLMLVIIIINAAYPTIMSLMYNKFSPLQDKELLSKIETLLDSVGFKSSGVFSVDASKRDNRLNAYFGGLGKTKRVVLFDTLIKKLSHEELLAVLGHELGHFKNKDIIKNIAVMSMIIFGMFFVIGNFNEDFFNSIGLYKEPWGIMSIFILISSMLTFFMMPLVNFISRTNEYKADEFGSSHGGKGHLVSALLKLVDENLSFPKSHPLYVFFYYSHPPLVDRLEKLGHHI